MFGSLLRNGLSTVPQERESMRVSSASMSARELLSVRVAVLFSAARIVSAKLFVEFAQRNVSPGGSTLDVSPNTLTDDSLPLAVRFLSFQSERSSAQSSLLYISTKSSEVVVPAVCTVCMKTFHEDSFASTFGITKKTPPTESAKRAASCMNAERAVRTGIGSTGSFQQSRR